MAQSHGWGDSIHPIQKSKEGRMANHLALRSLAAFVVATCSTCQVAQASADIGSASLSIDGLSFRLVDLAPDDGIAPSISFNGIWQSLSDRSLPVQPGMRSGPEWLPYMETTSRVPQAGSLLPTSAVQHTQDGWGGGTTLGGGAITAQSTLPADRFTAARDQATVKQPAGSYYLGNNQWRDDFYTQDSRYLIGWGKSVNALTLETSGVSLPWVVPAGDFTLSANTQLIIEGTVSSHIQLDRSVLYQARSAWLADVAGFGDYSPALTTQGSAQTSVSFSLMRASASWGTESQSFDLQDSLRFDGEGFIFMDDDGLGAHHDSALTYEKSVQKAFQISFANETGSSLTGRFMAAGSSAVEQYVRGDVHDYGTTSVIRPGLPPPGPTPQVPEPAAGLLAIAGGAMSWVMVRRRRA